MSFPGGVSGSAKPGAIDGSPSVPLPVTPAGEGGEGGVGGVGGVGGPTPPPPTPPTPPSPPVVPIPRPSSFHPSPQVSILLAGKLAEALNLSGKDVETVLTYIQECKMQNINAMTETSVTELNTWQKMTDICNKAAQDIKKKGIEQMQHANDLKPGQIATAVVSCVGATAGLVASIVVAVLTCGAASGAVAAAAAAEGAAVSGAAAAASSAVAGATVSVVGTCIAGVSTLGMLAMTGMQMSGAMDALVRHMDPKAASNMLMAINITLAVVGVIGGAMSFGGGIGVSRSVAKVGEITAKEASKAVEMTAMGASAAKGAGAATTVAKSSFDLAQGGIRAAGFMARFGTISNVMANIVLPVTQTLNGFASTGLDYMATTYQAEAQKYDAEADLARAQITSINQKAIDELVAFLQGAAKDITSAVSVCSQMLRDIGQRQETIARNTAI